MVERERFGLLALDFISLSGKGVDILEEPKYENNYHNNSHKEGVLTFVISLYDS